MINARLPVHNSPEEAIFLKRTLFSALLCLTLCFFLTGCASNADANPSPTAGISSPMTSPSVTSMPSPTDNGGLLSSNAPEITTVEDALTASKELRDAVEKLTEIDTAVAVAIGNMALVGITYDASYQGELDDRIRGMVLERAKAINPALTSVAVTDDASAFSEISSLYQMLQSGSPYTTIKTNADTLADSMSLYKG